VSIPSYRAAGDVSRHVEAHLARQIAAAQQAGQSHVGPAPDGAALEALGDVAFWASLRREEGYSPQVSLAFLPPADAGRPLLFEEPLPLTPDALTRLAPAVERPGIHLGVWPAGDALRIWGATRNIPPLCLVLEVVAPGLMVFKYPRRDDVGKFVNVAVLDGDEVKIIDERGSSLPDCPAIVTALQGFESPSTWSGAVNVFVELALSMRAHHRGGALLIVPTGSRSWSESIARPIHYAVSPPFLALAEQLRAPDETRAPETLEAMRPAIDAVAGLTAVDGATILTQACELLAFGAKIVRRQGHVPVEQVTITEPIEGVVPRVVSLSGLGGTRHLSAAQFVQDQQTAVALVASQDGRFTVFAWSHAEKRVHAHRVEVLLL
jgi:hypothetical protein